MTDPKKRIIVDGMDFRKIFHFPRILGSITSALQPPRMVISLLMVVALMAFGDVWDGFSTPRISPHGLAAGCATDEDHEHLRLLMHTAIEKYVPEADRPADDTEEMLLGPDQALELIDAGYEERHVAMLASAGAAEDDDGAPEASVIEPMDLAAYDASYRADRRAILDAAPRGAFEAMSAAIVTGLRDISQAALNLSPLAAFDAGCALFVEMPIALWKTEPWFTIVFGVFLAFVIALGGGALARMAACDFASHERLRVRDAVDFALGNWVKLFVTAVLPLLMAGLLALVLLVAGLLFAPWLDVIGGLLYGLALFVGFLIVFLLVGYVLGFPMLIPAVASENCDPTDAQQRAYGYLLNRPLHLLGYFIVGLIGLVLGLGLVSFFASAMLNATAALTGAFLDAPALANAGRYGMFDLVRAPADASYESLHGRWAGWLVNFWERLIVDLVAAYVLSYFFAASTRIYLLMRLACDGQSTDEIWRPGLAPGSLAPTIARDDTAASKSSDDAE